MGNDEAILKFGVISSIKTADEKMMPRIDPNAANEFPHLLAILSFFLKSKDPIAPARNNEIINKNPVCDVMALSICLFFWLLIV